MKKLIFIDMNKIRMTQKCFDFRKLHINLTEKTMGKIK